MNWCSEYGKWGKVHFEYYSGFYGKNAIRKKALELVDFSQSEDRADAVYSNGVLQVSVSYSFDEQGYFVQKFIFDFKKMTLLLNAINETYDKYGSAQIEECLKSVLLYGNYTA